MKADRIFRFVHKLLPALWAAAGELVEARKIDSEDGRKLSEDEREAIGAAFMSHLPTRW